MTFKLKIPKIFQNNTKWLERQQSSILSAAFIITIANIISSLSGLVRERLLIQTYFSTELSQQAYEAFQVAFQIPDMLFQLIVLGALSAAFIPIFTKYKKRNKEQAFAITANFMNILILVFLIFSAVVFVWAKPLTMLRTGDAFTADQVNIAATLTQIMLVAQLFFAVSNFLTGVLQSYQRFILPAIAPIFYNLGILLGVYFFSSTLGIYAAGAGVVIGALLHMIIQLPLAWKLGFRFKMSLRFFDSGAKEFFKLIPLRVLTLSVSEIQNLALAFFATTVGNLSFVTIKLALRLMTIPIRLFGVPISQASLPFLSEESEESDQERFSQLIVQSLNQISFLAIPASVLLLILRIPIVRIVFGASNFPWKTTVATGKLVAIIAISVAVQAMVSLLIRVFHALKDTKTPFIVAVLTALFYLLFSWLSVFVWKIGATGIAIATSVAAFIEVLLFLILLERKIKGLFINKRFLLPQFKMILASFLMAIFLYLPFKILDELVFDTSKTLELIYLTVTTSTIGMLVYMYFVVLFDVKELRYFVALTSKFGKWRKALRQTSEVVLETNIEGKET